MRIFTAVQKRKWIEGEVNRFAEIKYETSKTGTAV